MSFQIFRLASFFLCFIYAAEGHIPSGDYRDIPNSFFDSKREVPLVKNFQKNDGSYRFGYKLTDQMREETRNPDGEVSGSYGFIDPAGAVHELQYRAGRQGFLAQGTSLPKAPSYTPEVLEARKKFLNYFKQMKNFLKSMSGDDDSESDSNSDSKSEEEEHWDSKKSKEEEYDSSEENDYEGGEESEEEEDGGEHEEEANEGEEHEGEEDEGGEHEGKEDEGGEHEGKEHEGGEHEGEEHEGEEHVGEPEGEEPEREKHEGNDPDEVTLKQEGNLFEEGQNKRKSLVYNKNKRNTESLTEEKITESAKLRNKSRRKETSEIEEGNLSKVINEDKMNQTMINEDKKDSITFYTEPKDELKETQKENGETKENERKELLKEKINKGRLGEVKKESKRDISSVSKFQNWIENPQKRRFPRLVMLARKFISS